MRDVLSLRPESQSIIIGFKIAAFHYYFIVRITGMLEAGGKWFIFKTIFFNMLICYLKM